MDVSTRNRTLAAAAGAATLWVAACVAIGRSLDRHVVRGESMKPALLPRDTVVSIRFDSLVGRALRRCGRPRVGDIVVATLPWEHDLVGVKRLVAGPGQSWTEGDHGVAAGPGWAAVGDERVLSTDSRHHGRLPDDALLALVVSRIPPPS